MQQSIQMDLKRTRMLPGVQVDPSEQHGATLAPVNMAQMEHCDFVSALLIRCWTDVEANG
jgi:hypothetical protein